MINLPNKDEFKIKYMNYADYYLKLISDKYKEIPDDISIKKQHGLSMMNAVEEVAKNSNMFNESYFLSFALEGCAHDIGRFPQFYLIGTLNDRELEKYTNFKDHGNYAKELLLKNNKKLLRYFLPNHSIYDFVFSEVLCEHTNIRNNNYMYSIEELKNEFYDYSFKEILESTTQDKINKLISIKLKILQEVDSLELLQNIISGAWSPKLGNEPKDYINPQIWDDFINFKYINMAQYKKNGIWTTNSGFLLRYGLLTHKVNFVGTLKQFKNSKGFDLIWDKSIKSINDRSKKIIDPIMLSGQEYIKIAIDNLINCSEDGVLITPKSREEAKQFTLKMWGTK